MRSERGQATVEYIALIAIFALLLAAAAAAASSGGAPSIVNAVLGQMRQALCVVTGSACPALRQQPCVVASDRRMAHVAVSFAVLRIGSDRILIREDLSDGTVRLTLARRSAAGVEAGLGARAQVQLRGRAIGSERDARIGAEGMFGYGEVFVARDAHEADRIMRRLLRPRLPFAGDLPGPREIFAEGGIRALGRLGLGSGLAGASLDGLAEGILGARRDQRSGEITLSLNAGGSGWALVSALMAGHTRSSDRAVGLELKLDRHGRPMMLTLRASGKLAAGEMLAPTIPGRQGFAPAQAFGDAVGGRRWELEARLDLDDPGAAAAWSAFRRHHDDPAALRELAARLRERSHLDVRSYALRNTSAGASAGVALALRIGAEGEVSIDRARLLSAATRPPGGLWEQRIDCEPA